MEEDRLGVRFLGRMLINIHLQLEEFIALVIHHFLDEQRQFRNPATLLQPESFLSFLLIMKSVTLRDLFYSTGLYMAIPMKMVDQLFSLPFSVILWLSSWCDENSERSAHFHSPEFTRMCVQHCRASGTRINMAHLAILCDIKPTNGWVRLLIENGADLTEFLQLGPTNETGHIHQFGNLILAWNPGLAKVNLDIFCNSLSGISPFGLATLVGNYLTMDSFLALENLKVFKKFMLSLLAQPFNLRIFDFPDLAMTFHSSV